MTENKYGRGFVKGIGRLNPELMIIGAYAGKYEVEAGVPFAGPSGELLDDILKQAGLRRGDVYLTNVLKYQPLEVTKLKDWKDHDSVNRLWDEIAAINPKKILALGAVPLFFLTGKTGITEWRGSVLRSQQTNHWVIGTYNPAHLLYQTGGEIQGWWQKLLIEFDTKRAAELPLNFTLPNRHLWIARNSLHVHEYFTRNRDNKICSTDIEVLRCIPCCISFAFSKNEAISIPLFRNINGIQVCDIPERDINEIWRIIDKVLREKQVDGQNFKFDQERLEHELLFKIGHFRSDTMLKAAVLAPELPKSQAFLTSINTFEPYYKDEGKEFNPKRDKIDQFLLYNAKDSAVNREISDVQDKDLREAGLYDYYYGYYHNLHNFYYELEQNGLNVDENQRTVLIGKYQGMLDGVNKELERVLGWLPKSVAGNSRDLPLVVYETLKMPRRDSLDEETLVALAANNCKTEEQRIGLQMIIERRRLEKILGPDRLGFRPDWDGKARTLVKICGTETGRSSNVLLKPPTRRNKTGLGFQTMSKHGDVGKDFRSMFVPSKGRVLINLDLSQADARVVALLSKDDDLLRLFELIDIHKFTAAIGQDLAITRKYNTAAKAIIGVEEINRVIASITSDERFIGKGTRHSGNYDAGKRKFMIKLNTDAKRFHVNVQISEWKAGKLLENFHKFSPKIRSIFHEDIKEVLNNTRQLIRPDGSVRIFFDRLGPDMYREAYADIPQHTVVNQVRRAAMNLKKQIPQLPILVESHDAFLMEWDEREADDVAKLGQELMRRPIDFSGCSLPRGTLVIPSDAEFGYNYADMKKKKAA